ncbi:acyltransferase [Nocardioides zeae]|uniref:Acyltransferase n=1 Tax=Nocardioides zeae TaxID=1457234 RepID=A0A6P0HNW0_9ACTN|nr:acyltransferase [Nocardioides zeae]
MGCTLVTEVTKQAYRGDVQGLRAIAVGLVVLYHAGLPWLSGGYVGVDVFFVISGFLITNHLLSELTRTGRVQFAAFYARRARRILPASVVVLLLTLVASVLWLPRLQWRATFEQALATALYVPNLLFAKTGTDYLADSTPSVYQHYWSLGIEEQFYLIWPVLLVGSYIVVRRSQARTALVTVLLVVSSLLACVLLTGSSQPDAFFLLPTRAWELGAGALLALAAAQLLRVPQVLRVAGAWAGLALVAGAAVLYDSDVTFPGYAATVPVVGTALLIAFGDTEGPGPRRLLSLRPMVFIGTISYSLYLVHWPILTIPKQAGDYPGELSPLLAAVLVLASVVASWFLFNVVERPAQNASFLRRTSAGRSLGAAAALTVVAASTAAVAFVLFHFVPLHSDRTAAERPLVREPEFTDYVPANLEPSLEGAADDNPAIYATDCHAGFAETDPVGCVYGRESAPIEVTLFGDSHAAQWFPALEVAAATGRIRLTVHTKSSCPSVDIVKMRDGNRYTQCETWRDAVIRANASDPADLVVVANYARSDGFDRVADLPREWEDGLESSLERLEAAGSRALVIADTPEFPGVPAVCLSANLDDANACAVGRDDAVEDELQAAEESAAAAADAEFVDLTDWLCDSDTCGPIIGDRLVYRDSNHVTAEMSEALASPLLEAIEEAVEASGSPDGSP